MATRHQVRETVVGLLYAQDMGNEDIAKHLDIIFEEKKIRNKQRDFALSLYEGVKENLEKIDAKIDMFLKDWTLLEIGSIERAILRLAAYELMFTDLDRAVIINEAIELSKELGSETSPKFINGVLDSVKKALA